MARKKLILLTAVAAVLTLGGVIFWQQRIRRLPFDAGRWAQREEDVRFRMKDALIAKYRAGQIQTRNDLKLLLGPPDQDGDGRRWMYFMKQWTHNPWYLLITFDESGNISYLGAHPS